VRQGGFLVWELKRGKSRRKGGNGDPVPRRDAARFSSRASLEGKEGLCPNFPYVLKKEGDAYWEDDISFRSSPGREAPLRTAEKKGR